MTLRILSSDTKKLLEEATKSYTDQLFANGQALTYLVKRGLTRETVESFRLGLVTEPYPESGHDFQKDRLAIPYVTPTGIVQIRFRALPFSGIPGDPEPSPKMKSETGASTTLYNVKALSGQNSTIAICEGEFDTMSAVQAGIPAVGVPGSKAWSPVFRLAFKYRKVIILADNDDHGEGLQMAENIMQSVPGARVVLMPEGEDVNSFLVKNDEKALRELANYES